MEHGYRFRIYPNKKQQLMIQHTFDCCRWVWNETLSIRNKEYSETGKVSNMNEYVKMIPVWKSSKAPWLKDADSIALQQTLRDLNGAYLRFFNNPKKVGFPKFKLKRSSKKSYRTTNSTGSVAVINSKKIKLPKLGVVSARVSRHVVGRISNATISQTPSGKYYVSFCCISDNKPQIPDGTIEVMGIDVGVHNLIARSDGVIVKNPKSHRKAKNKIARASRKLSKKKEGSKNWYKQKQKLATIYERATNQRKDAIHKATTQAVRESQAIAVEDLHVSSLILKKTSGRKNLPEQARKDVNSAIYDASFATVIKTLEYKCNWYGRKFIKVNPSKTTETCSKCGSVREMKITRRTYRCKECGNVLDRDVNAARNIANRGTALLSTVGHTESDEHIVKACGAESLH